MGTLISIECKKCSYWKSVSLGIGFAYAPHSLMDFNSKGSCISNRIRSKKTLELVKTLILEHNGDFTDYENKLYRCPKCSEFYERFFYHIGYDTGSFEPVYKCTKCKHALELVPEIKREPFGEATFDLTNYPCPQCGERSISYGESGSWD